MLKIKTGAALIAVAATTPLWGQIAPDGDAGKVATQTSLTNVTVTANRRKQLAGDVAGSISVLGGEKLDELGVTGVADLATYVPGLVVTGSGPGLQQMAIRGISTGITQVNSTVAIYIDESPVSFNSSYAGGSTINAEPNPLDLERVEVLRGPQGSLYGASALGGLVKYVTIEPDLRKLNGRAEVGYSSVANGGQGTNFRAAVNVPIQTDVLAVRASTYSLNEPGYIESVSSGKSQVNKTNLKGSNVSVLLKPSSAFNARLSADTAKVTNDDASPLQADAVTLQPANGDLLKTSWQLAQPTKTESHRVNLTLNYDMRFANLMSSTSTYKAKTDYLSDLSPAYSGLFPYLPLFGLSGNTVSFVGGIETTKKTQEFRLTSPGGQSIDWMLGAFYTEESIAASNDSDLLNGPAGGPFATVVNLLSFKYGATLKDTSIYGNTTLKLSDAFDIQLGLRQASIDQTYSQAEGSAFSFATLSPSALPSALTPSGENHTTWLISPKWRLNPLNMVYGRIATGYRPGGPNFLIPSSTAQKTFDTDTLVNTEFGVKGAAASGKFDYAVALFNIDWKNIQAPGIDHSTPANYNFYSNGGRAHSRGLELEGRWRPTDALLLAGNAAFSQGKLDEDINIDGVNAKAGDGIPFVAPVTLTISGDYSTSLGGGIDAAFGMSLRHVGERNAYFDHTLFGDPATGQIAAAKLPAYQTVDLRASFTKAPWTLGVQLKNATNQRGIASLNGGLVTGVPGAFTPAGLTIIQPRTLGINLRVDF